MRSQSALNAVAPAAGSTHAAIAVPFWVGIAYTDRAVDVLWGTTSKKRMNVLAPSFTGDPCAAVPRVPVNAVGRKFVPTGLAVPTTRAPVAGEVAGLTVVGLSGCSVDAADGTVLDVCQPAGKRNLREPPVPAEAVWLSG